MNGNVFIGLIFKLLFISCVLKYFVISCIYEILCLLNGNFDNNILF